MLFFVNVWHSSSSLFVFFIFVVDFVKLCFSLGKLSGMDIIFHHLCNFCRVEWEGYSARFRNGKKFLVVIMHVQQVKHCAQVTQVHPQCVLALMTSLLIG